MIDFNVFPIPPLAPAYVADLLRRVNAMVPVIRMLELRVEFQQRLLTQVVDELRRCGGNAAIGQASIDSANCGPRARVEAVSVVENLQEWLRKKDTGKAAGMVRDVTGMTWDEAYGFVSAWNNKSAAALETAIASRMLAEVLSDESGALLR